MTESSERYTSGSSRRAGRKMSGRGQVFNWRDELQLLREDLPRASGGRAAKTLAKTDVLRVTLVLLASGATLNPESATGGASVHVVDGRLRMQTEGEQWELSSGDLIVLEENLREPITALAETAFLVTVAWPSGAGASDDVTAPDT